MVEKITEIKKKVKLWKVVFILFFIVKNFFLLFVLNSLSPRLYFHFFSPIPPPGLSFHSFLTIYKGGGKKGN